MCDPTAPSERGVPTLSVPVVPSEVPLARPITPVGPTPTGERPPPDPPLGEPGPSPAGGLGELRPLDPGLIPRLCRLDVRDGCYEVTLRPSFALRSRVGTVRIDRAAPDAGADGVIVSGDLYNSPLPVLQGVEGISTVPIRPEDEASSPDVTAASLAGAVSEATLVPSIISRLRPRIPIHPRSRYHSYLRGTRLVVPLFALGGSGCKVTIDLEQFDYTHPPAGQHKGSFPASANRSLRFVLERTTPPFPYSLTGGPYLTGRYSEGGVDKGTVTLAWVSPFLRRAVLEVDTLQDAVAPKAVPHPSGTGTEFFDTIFAQAGWDLRVVQDQVDIPVPAGVAHKDCWSSAQLHSLMTSVRNPATNLDTEWRTHLIVVPAKITCSRGVMYDQIGVPREGSASFSDDGYPTSHSSNFGSAAGKKQRDVPRAYLRSAAHEVTHAFNQIHQEQETAADNSIMTTTPSVADVLGGPSTGAPGVFPDQIALALNSTVRNHLAHMPDPVIRPGGWPFASWFGTPTPQASDRAEFAPSELDLVVSVDDPQPAFGAPVVVRWTMTNTSSADLLVPNDVSTEALFAAMSVTDDRGDVRPVRPFVIRCDAARLEPLAPGDSRSAEHTLFWSSDGFALDRPGHHEVTVRVEWSAGGLPVTVGATTDVWVDYPTGSQENADAALVMHPDVGKWVALHGGADHIPEAVERLGRLGATATPEAGDGAGASRVAAAFAAADLLPDGATVAEAAGSAPTKASGRRSPAKKAPATKKAGARKASTTKKAPARKRSR